MDFLLKLLDHENLVKSSSAWLPALRRREGWRWYQPGGRTRII